ncbi:YvrJ family protein [Priestia megaterium]|jgi:YvrJ protein family|uniref:YvrJ family protein n=1 Tax=Priestia megaterium TaxID=1404 RepID=UPI0023DA438C|nr:YvrJ family protein [Priestia megaterium]MDF2013875.1 YvrJ family protein [Priestia megaterium]MDF2052734.1 YvrJ family protein [Priestia megaterium]MDF2058856.1 YvrJ family protein [Priestia megaterium]MED3855178.1 YvrJ family protein [Priestia megaterium]
MTVIEMPQWISILGNFGFPIAITIYLFFRFEKKLEKLELVIVELGEIIKDTRRD